MYDFLIYVQCILVSILFIKKNTDNGYPGSIFSPQRLSMSAK